MNWKDPEYLKKEYVEKQRSTSDIAKEHGIFPNTVRRELKRNGFSIRDKSAAQKVNIEKNGAPMEGRVRTAEEKERISAGLQRFWDELSPEQVAATKNKLSEVARGKWESLSPDEKRKAIKKMHRASNNRLREGSKNENMVADLIAAEGYKVEQRTNEYTPGRQFEIDICIPSINVAIEWDGATHFDPIYGDENLAKVQAKDDKKNQILLSAGWTVIRCRDHSTAPSLAFCKRSVAAIVDVIKNGKKKTLHVIEAK